LESLIRFAAVAHPNCMCSAGAAPQAAGAGRRLLNEPRAAAEPGDSLGVSRSGREVEMRSLSWFIWPTATPIRARVVRFCS